MACEMAAFSVPMPSGVLALIPIRSGSICSSSATRSRILCAWGPILGAAKIKVESMFSICSPAVLTRLSASARNTAESAPFHRGSEGENNVPMSGAAIAPSSASVIACNRTSPSECPPKPCGWSISTPPI